MEISATHPQADLEVANPIGILGASSVVAEYLTTLLAGHYHPLLFSRSLREGQNKTVAAASVPCWISVIPIWATPNYFDLLLARGARRIVAVSSTSRFTKMESPINSERLVAAQLAEGEQVFAQWARAHNVEFLILRSTMVYGRGRVISLRSRALSLDLDFSPSLMPQLGSASHCMPRTWRRPVYKPSKQNI
jgi:hypothetical protein